MAPGPPPDAAARGCRPGRLVSQQRKIATHQHNGHRDQQQPDEQARRTVPQRRSRDSGFSAMPNQRFLLAGCRMPCWLRCVAAALR
jgi:hypothetical protein